MPSNSSNITALQATGFTRIGLDKESRVGVVVQDSTNKAAAQIANNLSDILAERVASTEQGEEIFREEDGDYLSDLITNVTAVLSDKSNKLENAETGRLKHMLALAVQLKDKGSEAIPKIKQALIEDNPRYIESLKELKKPELLEETKEKTSKRGKAKVAKESKEPNQCSDETMEQKLSRERQARIAALVNPSPAKKGESSKSGGADESSSGTKPRPVSEGTGEADTSKSSARPEVSPERVDPNGLASDKWVPPPQKATTGIDLDVRVTRSQNPLEHLKKVTLLRPKPIE